MAFPVAAAIAGGASIFGSIMGASGGVDAGETSASARAAAIANDREIMATREANKITDRRITEGRDWQEGMRSSAYQTSVADMQAANINPAVAMAGGGGAASAPGTSAPGAIKADVGGASRASSAQAMARSAEKRARTDTGRLAKDVALAGSGIISAALSRKKTSAEIEAVNSAKKHTDLLNEHQEAVNVPVKQQAEFYKDNPWAGYYKPVLSPANSAVKAVMTMFGLKSAGKSFSKGLRKSWDKKPPKSQRPGWGSNH